MPEISKRFTIKKKPQTAGKGIGYFPALSKKKKIGTKNKFVSKCSTTERTHLKSSFSPNGQCFTTFTFNQCDLLDLPSMKNEKFKYRKCIYSKSHNVMCFNFLCGIKIRVTEFGCSFKVFLKFFC